MSVSNTVVLPAQPDSGELFIRPLGGNGYISPQSYYVLQIDLDSDASTGISTIRVDLDPQYQGVVALMSVKISSGAADRQVRLDLFPEIWKDNGRRFAIQELVVVDSDVGQNLMFTPPPMFDIGRVQSTFDNVDTENQELVMIIYNFRRDAAQKVPLNVLLAALPRGFDINGG